MEMTGVRRGLEGGERCVSGEEGRDDRGPSEFCAFEGQLGDGGGDWSSFVEPPGRIVEEVV